MSTRRRPAIWHGRCPVRMPSPQVRRPVPGERRRPARPMHRHREVMRQKTHTDQSNSMGPRCRRTRHAGIGADTPAAPLPGTAGIPTQPRPPVRRTGNNDRATAPHRRRRFGVIGGVMAYGYRGCLTTAADRVPVTRSDDHDEGYWELGRRLFHHWARQGYEPRAGELLGLEPNLPGGKCDGNSLGPFSLNVLDGSAWEYPDADPGRREELRRHHLRHTRDFLWFRTHDPVVPAPVRRELARWG